MGWLPDVYLHHETLSCSKDLSPAFYWLIIKVGNTAFKQYYNIMAQRSVEIILLFDCTGSTAAYYTSSGQRLRLQATYNKPAMCIQATGYIHCIERWGETRSQQGPTAQLCPGATLLVNPALLSALQQEFLAESFRREWALYSLCAAAYLPLLSICSSQTHPPPLTCHSHYASFLGGKKKKKPAKTVKRLQRNIGTNDTNTSTDTHY